MWRQHNYASENKSTLHHTALGFKKVKSPQIIWLGYMCTSIRVL